MTESPAPANRPAPPPENVWINLICNVLVPGFLLNYLSKPERLGPVWGMVISLAIPLGYGIWDYFKRRTWNVLSALGFASILLTGALGLTKTQPIWYAVKEGAFPILIGLAIPISLRTRQPLVKTLLYNDQILDTHRIATALSERQAGPDFERLLVRASWILAASFLVSGIANFLLARWIVVAPSGTPEYNAQVGRMHWIAWPVIMLPMFAVMLYALFGLLNGIERLTGLKRDDLFRQPPAKSGDAPKSS